MLQENESPTPLIPNYLHKMLSEHQEYGFFYNLAHHLFNISELITLVFIRKEFGERFISAFKIILYTLVSLVISSWLFSSGKEGATAMFIFTFLFFVFGGLRLNEIRIRQKNNIRWHSYYDGKSFAFFNYLPFATSEGVIKTYHEPLILMIIGITSSITYSPILGALINVSALTIFSSSYIATNTMKNKFLDMVDNEIESTNMQDMFSGQPPEKTEGYVVRGFSDIPEALRDKRLKMLSSKTQ